MRFVPLALAFLATLASASPIHSKGSHLLQHRADSHTTTSIINHLSAPTGNIVPRHIPSGYVFPRKYTNTTTSIFNLFPTPTAHIGPRSHVPTGHVIARSYPNRTTSETNPSPVPTNLIAPISLDQTNTVDQEHIVRSHLRKLHHTTLTGHEVSPLPAVNPEKVFAIEFGKWNDCIQHHIINDPFHRGQLLVRCGHPPQEPAPANIPTPEGYPQVNARAIPFSHHLRPHPITLVTRATEDPLPTMSLT
ncbi:MAG: hypothetical protein Q9209_001271 [Squamulea sp. 1 TL-2023]